MSSLRIYRAYTDTGGNTLKEGKSGMMPEAERKAKGMWWDRAWSLVTGCKEVSDGCNHCWAAREAHMRANHPIRKIADHYRKLTLPDGKWNGNIREEWDNLSLPVKTKKPTVWAVWNDLYHPAVSWNFIYKAYEMMWLNPRHLFFVLTKRPELMANQYDGILFHFRRNYPSVDFPRNNIFHGTTVENQHWADIRIPELLKVPGPKMLSVEPMLDKIDIGNGLAAYMPLGKEGIDLVVCGCESGSHRRPMQTELAIDLRNQCIEADVPFFMKQMEIDGKVCHDIDRFPEELRVREWPGDDQ